MRSSFLHEWLAAIFLFCVATASIAQQDTAPVFRSPATPLVVHDPYFSIWSTTDRLTDGPTRHWTGVPQELNGLVRVDDKNYRFLGDAVRSIPALQETGRQITPTRTIVTLQNAEIELRVTFLSPVFPDDLRIMGRPITYLVSPSI